MNADIGLLQVIWGTGANLNCSGIYQLRPPPHAAQDNSGAVQVQRFSIMRLAILLLVTVASSNMKLYAGGPSQFCKE